MFVSAVARVRNSSALRLAIGTTPLKRSVCPCEEKRLVTASTCCVAGAGTLRAVGQANEIMGLLHQRNEPPFSETIASSVGYDPQLYCAYSAQHPKQIFAMSIRTLLLLVIAVPALLLGGAKALGMAIPLPEWGRDYVQRILLDPPPPELELPDIAGPDDPSRPLVVLDAGHGGRDPGSIGRDANGNEVLEKDIVLALAMAVREQLLEAGGIRVALTRSDDTIVTLSQRPEIARQLDADLFLSIHADSAGDRDDIAGASIYTLSNEASSEAAARFAERENAADRLNGVSIEGQSDEVSAILVELSQQRTQDDATEFASLIRREGQGRVTFHPQARRSAELAVLRAPDVPGVLFESGFVTNESDRARLMTEEGRAEYAEVLAQAIRVYLARRAETD